MRSLSARAIKGPAGGCPMPSSLPTVVSNIFDSCPAESLHWHRKEARHALPSTGTSMEMNLPANTATQSPYPHWIGFSRCSLAQRWSEARLGGTDRRGKRRMPIAALERTTEVHVQQITHVDVDP